MPDRLRERIEAALICPYHSLDFSSAAGVRCSAGRAARGSKLLYLFGDYALDCDRRELHRGANLIPLQPQVFDLLEHLIRHRDHVVGKDDLNAAIWGGRFVSDSALTARINAARTAIGDSGEKQ